MLTINIPESDSTVYYDFISGKTVQVKAVALNAGEHDLDKGMGVSIVHLNMKADGVVVSDPVVIDDDGRGKKVLSVTVRKVEPVKEPTHHWSVH